MNQNEASAQLSISMTSFPNDRMVSAASKLVSEFCFALVGDNDVAHRFHMAAQELAENLAKYSSGEQVSLRAELTSGDEGTVLELSATNQSSPAQLEEVERHLRELTTAEDPVALYDRLILESAPSEESSGLGLARIRAEGEFDVKYQIQGSELTVSVRASIHPSAK